MFQHELILAYDNIYTHATIPNHDWECLAYASAIILLFILKYIADEHQYYNHAHQINLHRH